MTMMARICNEEMLRNCLNATETSVYRHRIDGDVRDELILTSDPEVVDVLIGDTMEFVTEKVDMIDLKDDCVYAEFHHFAEDWGYDRFHRRYELLYCCPIEEAEIALLEEHLAVQEGVDPRADSDNEEDWNAFWEEIVAMKPSKPEIDIDECLSQLARIPYEWDEADLDPDLY